MIALDEFVAKLEAEFEELETGTLTPETNYRNLDSWSSMHALIIIAFVDAEFDVLLKPDQLRNAETVADLYNTVKSQL